MQVANRTPSSWRSPTETPKPQRVYNGELSKSAMWTQFTPIHNNLNRAAATDRSKYSSGQRKSSMSRSQHMVMSMTNGVQSAGNMLNQESRRLRLEKEQLSVKCNMLMNKLREVAPESDDSLYQLVEHTDARIRQLQEHMKFKKDKIMGYYKVKVATLLERYGYKATELNFHKVTTEGQLIELMVSRFAEKDVEIQSLWLQREEQLDKMRLFVSRHQQEMERYQLEIGCLKEALQRCQAELDDANNEIAAMGRMLNSRRIEESMKVEREKLQFDREMLTEDAIKTRTTLKEIQQYYTEQMELLQRRNKQLESKLAQLSKQLVDERIRFKEAELRADTLRTDLQQSRIHLKIERENTEKQHRQAIRWKDRFQQIDGTNRTPQIYRTPVIQYRKTSSTPGDNKNKSLTTVQASALYDRKGISRDERALGIFLDKEIRKLESDLSSQGKLSGSHQKDQ